jgi:diaminohydroxyphosphoribosylaminopyrimidine deaminase / 5-amino-6-(5-phosphoribosylamino)uracil reductase
VTDADRDEAHMARAIVLAERGRGTTAPNPMVGCVVVRDGEVVGEGWHERPGGAHAEVAALAAAGERARGATVYVTLEPCDHHGRTPPCTDALLDAGVARVVYAVDDPSRAGARRLADAGIEVVGGVLGARAETQNAAFLRPARTGRPTVTLKLAQTLDGQLSVPGRRWITGEEARRAVHEQRARSDVVLVGSQTVLDDDPRLDVRHVEAPGGQPRPAVLDGRGRIPVDAAVVRDRAVVFTTERSEQAWRSAIAERGAEVVTTAPAQDGGVDLREVLAALAERDVHQVLAEGGASVARALVADRLVDRLVLHIALGLIGPHGMPRVCPAAQPPPGAGWSWRTERTGYLGDDLEVVAVPSDDRARAGAPAQEG